MLSLSSHQVDNTMPSTIKVFISNHTIPAIRERKLIFFSATGRKLLVKADFFLLWIFFLSTSKLWIDVFVANVVGPYLGSAASKWKSNIIHFTLGLVQMRRRSNTLTRDNDYPVMSQSDKFCACPTHGDTVAAYPPTGLASVLSLRENSSDLTGQFSKQWVPQSILCNTCIDNFTCLKGGSFHNAT